MKLRLGRIRFWVKVKIKVMIRCLVEGKVKVRIMFWFKVKVKGRLRFRIEDKVKD